MRIKYIRRHPHKFETLTIPVIICYMKLTVELTLEIVCLLITASYTDVPDIVMNYIAIGCIS